MVPSGAGQRHVRLADPGRQDQFRPCVAEISQLLLGKRSRGVKALVDNTAEDGDFPVIAGVFQRDAAESYAFLRHIVLSGHIVEGADRAAQQQCHKQHHHEQPK